MDTRERSDLVVLVAGVLGVELGLALRKARHRPDSQDLTVMGPSTLLATPALARVTSEVLDLDSSDPRIQAAVSFLVGAVLAFFADGITRYLPRVSTRKSLPEG